MGEVVDEVDIMEGTVNDVLTPAGGTVPTPGDSGSATNAGDNVAAPTPPANTDGDTTHDN